MNCCFSVDTALFPVTTVHFYRYMCYILVYGETTFVINKMYEYMINTHCCHEQSYRRQKVVIGIDL